MFEREHSRNDSSKESFLKRHRGSYLGCTSSLTVLVAGIGLSLFGLAFGGSCSARVPLTEANISLGGSIGSKDATRRALPEYLATRVGTSDNFINATRTLTIGPAEGTNVFVIGEQEGSPSFIELHLSLNK